MADSLDEQNQTLPQECAMTRKTVLITGANKSIGFETARQLGKLGYRIWLGSRDSARGTDAAEKLVAEGLDVQMLEIDVTNDDSVKAAAALVDKADGKLDVLINNAGIPGGEAMKPLTPSVQPLSK